MTRSSSESVVAVRPSEALAKRYVEVRRCTERLAAPLSAEDQMVMATPEASPTKWHQAHTTWFFETFLLSPHLPGYCEFHPDFRWFFNSYYNQVAPPPDRNRRGHMSRPSLEEVKQYRAHVDAAMLRLLNGELSSEVRALVEIGLNHEQQHQELIVTDIKFALSVNPLKPAYLNAALPDSESPAPQRWIEYDGGIQHIGHDGNGFAFDNELPRHDELLRPYALANRLVTNAEYATFIEDGAYLRPELWLSDGWDTVRAQHWDGPLYWHQRDGQWWSYTLTGTRRVDPNEPVCHVSYFEADAYARWAGARLATEFEWENAASSEPIHGNFLDNQRFHPSAAAPSTGIVQIFGDVWEWTSSPYTGYPGYKPPSGAVGEYNGKFMCNQFVLRGGSCATPRSHIRATYRNFFPPQTRWQFSGIRLAHDRA